MLRAVAASAGTRECGAIDPLGTVMPTAATTRSRGPRIGTATAITS